MRAARCASFVGLHSNPRATASVAAAVHSDRTERRAAWPRRNGALCSSVMWGWRQDQPGVMGNPLLPSDPTSETSGAAWRDDTRACGWIGVTPISGGDRRGGALAYGSAFERLGLVEGSSPSPSLPATESGTAGAGPATARLFFDIQTASTSPDSRGGDDGGYADPAVNPSIKLDRSVSGARPCSPQSVRV